jgi:hypothetical protein
VRVIAPEKFRREVDRTFADPRVRRFGPMRAWLDAHGLRSRVWQRLRREADERLKRYGRGEDV